MCKVNSFSDLVFKDREKERDWSEAWEAAGKQLGALDKDSLALAFVSALPSHIFIRYVYVQSTATKVTGCWHPLSYGKRDPELG